jgi:hypothetical protein
MVEHNLTLVHRDGIQIPLHARKTFERLEEYFTEERIEKQLLPFMNENEISGRMCDYLMTTYSRKYSCPIRNGDVRHFYDMALKEAHGRRFFDPFNRTVSGIPVRFKVPKTSPPVEMTSTVAQINFVRWYFSFGINEFIAAHKLKIAADMRNTYRRINSEKKQMTLAGSKRKRQALIGPHGKRRTIVFKQTTVIVMT